MDNKQFFFTYATKVGIIYPVMVGGTEIPPIRVAEVFVDGRCVGFLSDVTLSREENGGFMLEGDWSGYSNVLGNSSQYTISIPRYDCKFLAVKVEADPDLSSGRVMFKNASFLPDGPGTWIDKPGEA